MKKLLLTLAIAITALVATDTFAWGRSGGSCCRAKKSCAPKCAPKAKICNTVVTEGPIPTQCCKRILEVQEAPLLTKHVNISYTCECPRTCDVAGEVTYIGEEKTYQTGKVVAAGA